MLPMTHRCGFVLLMLAGVSGCERYDPLTEADRWRPSDANQANLIAQLADPNDLISGQRSAVGDGQTAVEAVARLRRGDLKPLAGDKTTTAPVGGTTGGSSGADGGGN